MLRSTKITFQILAIATILSGVNAQSDNIQDLDPYVVRSGAVANETPVLTYANPISLLNFGPTVDVQSRNFAEAQGDISIRGGIFENTGFSVGSLNVFDPQTGHYTAELPVDPMMLYRPEILTGYANAVSAFNATVGSVNFSWKPVSVDQSLARLSFGENGLNTQSFYSSHSLSSNNKSGIDFGISRSESDGSIPFGDHDFKRASARYTHAGDNSQFTLFGGYQDKFFGWPNMYTPYGVQETEDIQTLLIIAEYKNELTTKSNVVLSGYYRENHDDYEFDRDRPGIFNPYEHKTKVTALHGEYNRTSSEKLSYYLSGDVYFDSIESTTLTNSFQSRTYGKVQFGGELLDLADQLDFSFNLAVTDTNRDAAMLNPSFRFEYDASDASSEISNIWYFEYARNTQVAGYTAIGSSPRGLFAGNQKLGVERSHNIELGIEHRNQNFAFQAATFFRLDRDLTDWTYSFNKTNARSANAVDIDTLGFETQLIYQTPSALLSLGYTFLQKQEDYGASEVDASFYALNFPTHRVTLSVTYKLLKNLELRIDNEFRVQEENSLRSSDDEAFLTYASLVYRPFENSSWDISVSVENLWDQEFEEIPAVPASRRQVAFQTSYAW